MKLISHTSNRSLLLAVTTLAATTASAYSPEYYKSESALSQGLWVKVEVVDNGIYQFTADQLREMGFSDPSKVVVCGYGGAALTNQKFNTNDPDDLPQTPVVRTADGRILFYGEGAAQASISYNQYYKQDLRINFSANGGCYFLTDSQSPMTIGRINRDYNNTINVTTHTSVEFYDFNEANPRQGGARFFSRNLKETGDRPLTFTTVAPVEGSTEGYITYTSVVKSSRIEPRFSVTLDDDITPGAATNNAGTILNTDSKIFGRVYGYQYFTLRGQGGSNDYTVNVAPTPATASNSGYTYGANDWVYFSYPSYNTLGDKSFRIMHFPGILDTRRIVVQLEQPTNATLVWDITDVNNIRQFNTFVNDETNQLWLTPDRDYNTSATPALRTVVFDTTKQFPTPRIIGQVDNQNIHSRPAPHMLIISNEASYSAAQRLAQAHRDLQGIDVEVFRQSEIFNEFSSGTPDVMAYRRAAKMFYDRDPEKFRSLLLFGHGIYDNRQISFKSDDALLTYETDDYDYMGTTATNYTSDDYFGLLDDYFNPTTVSSTKMSIAVGRIPAQSNADAVVDKIIRHMTTPIDRPYRNNVLVLADDNDANKHERQAEEVVEAMRLIAPPTTFTQVFNNVYPWRGEDAYEARQQIIQSLKQGQDLVTYVGHGNAENLTLFNYMWHKKYANSVPYSHLPIWILATCDTYAFDRLSDGIAETMLYYPNGGAIAVVGASRTVYADSNHYLNKALCKAFASATGATTIGQLYRQAHNEVMDVSDVNVHVNTMAFNLLGDPEVPYLAPEFNAQALTINNVSADGAPILYPLSDNTISGQITDLEGNPITNFNGHATISIYEAPITIMSSPKDGNCEPKPVNLDETLLAEVTTEVVDGKFTAQCVIPTSQRPDQTTRLSLWATDDDHTRIATGHCGTITISSTPSADTPVTDTTAPTIDQMYLDTEAFADGDKVGSSPVLYATFLPDPSGFNVSKSSIGSSVTLLLDNRTSFPGIRSTLAVQADGSASIEYPMSQLEDGRHSLTLSIGDNMGNRSSRTINFTVVNNEIQSTLTIDRKYARTEVTFDIDHTFDAQPTGRLIIEDANGQIVHSVEATQFPYTWNLKDAANRDIPTGNYRCYTLLNNGKRYSATDRIPLTVVR